MTWVNEETGEIHDEFAEGLVEIDLEEPEEAQQDGPLDWLGDWYTRQLVRMDAEEAAAKKQHDARMRELRARRRALAYRWGGALEVVTRAALTGKRKSVDYAYGRCGWRRSKRVEVKDEQAALEWAREHAPEAVKVRESLLKGGLPEDQEVPGVVRVDRDEFYARGGK